MTTRRPDSDTLLDQLTLEEQVALLAGADFWRTVPIHRLNIPALKVTDGPAGARGGGALIGGTPTTAFPVGIALGSTWNPALLRRIGEHLAREAQDKGAGVLLAPTVNLFRSTLNGRNFESYAEDPLLTGTLGTAYVQGLQSKGVAATVKHFVGNESEYQRNTISSEIPERALRELYLVPFEMTVRRGGAWAVMSAYNKVNGTYSSEHPRLLTDVLRGEWGFDGLVMSDWGGTHSAGQSVRAGLDLEMPGPAQARRGLLEEARQDGATRQAVRAAARRVLQLLERTGTLDRPRDVRDEAERAEEYADTRRLIRRAGAEGTVLLKNDRALLPLPAGARVAVIGPNAAQARVMGGGSAQLNAHRAVSPLDGLRAALGDGQVTFARGAQNDRFLPVLDTPLEIEYLDAEGAVLAREASAVSEKMWFSLPAGVPADFRARLTLTLDAPEAGMYDLSLASAGRSCLSVDGTLVVDNATNWAAGDTYFGFGSAEVRARTFLGAGPHRAVIDFGAVAPDPSLGIAAFNALRFGFRAPLSPTLIEEAAQLAAQADYAVVCVGTNGDWETEGVDRWGLTLPGRQDELVQAVARANPNTVVLLQTGGPVLMPWLPDVPAVVQAWFPGQEAGHAVADVLLGHADPGGRLPQTFPARLEDDPVQPQTPDVQYPGEQGRVAYQEGLFIGYRHVDRSGLTPLFPFGFGLSYTTFELGEAQLSAGALAPGDALGVTVPVRNTGDRAGQTVVQLYVQDVDTTLERPAKELKAFAKVTLRPGEEQTVTLDLDMRSLAYFDDVRHAWVADAGEFRLLIGQSSADLPVTASVRLLGEWAAPVRPAAAQD
ncbi:glycoside hydrolase family 3 C-terminal domain-containing protein [Deinococcus petrolearius]|uniref:Glycoside hydrolase family 3 C-terminal domain-containing protein n=1 Tax=Deinococcus petrolearius TaxID=1751295 RepID=A0ABW1DML0_9DEIO